ncbi:MAG: tetratricopeptide repeat protein [Vicinamibacteria bacterium]|nr:tetratricopeptide repeat protein [Vicinamibacteria bacterium]
MNAEVDEKLTSTRAAWLAAAAAWLAYLPSLWSGFLYDDQYLIVINESIRSLRNLRAILFFEPARPLLNLTWALNYAISALEPWSYHAFNVAIHAVNAALVVSLFAWVGRLSGRVNAVREAFVTGVIFGITPMAAETVVYVSARSSALATLFGLASLRLMLGLLAGAPRWRWAPALLLFVCGLATKEEAAVVPLLLLLLDYNFIARGSMRAILSRWRQYAPVFGVLILAVLARRAMVGEWLPAPLMGRPHYFLIQLAVYPLYFLRALIPLDPALFRDQVDMAWPPATLIWIGVVVTLVGGLLIFVRRRTWPRLALAALWMAICLLPSSSIVPLREVMADHRAYWGGAGVAYLLAGLLGSAFNARGALLVAILLARTLHFEWILADPARAWEDVLRRVPQSAFAHRALGDIYTAKGDWRAERELLRAIELDPSDPKTWTNYGVFLANSSRLGEAERVTRKAALLLPDNAPIRDNLSTILVARGNMEGAVQALEEADRLSPRNATRLIRLASLVAYRGQMDRARSLLTAAESAGVQPADRADYEKLRALLALQ